jgi:hypothetical protein
LIEVIFNDLIESNKRSGSVGKVHMVQKLRPTFTKTDDCRAVPERREEYGKYFCHEFYFAQVQILGGLVHSVKVCKKNMYRLTDLLQPVRYDTHSPNKVRHLSTTSYIGFAFDF